MADQPQVISEVQEDGTQKVTSAPGSRKMEVTYGRLDSDMPLMPTDTAMQKLFKPKNVIQITTDDGTVIPIVYKRIDPGSLLLSHGSPLNIPSDAFQTARRLQKQTDEIVKNTAEGSDEREQQQADLMASDDGLKMLEITDKMRRNAILLGVIQPQMTNEMLDDLEEDILNLLYECITEGVTTNINLVGHFPSSDNTSR